ncbi:unnamed protein product [Choristocarpus tenellus]
MEERCVRGLLLATGSPRRKPSTTQAIQQPMHKWGIQSVKKSWPPNCMQPTKYLQRCDREQQQQVKVDERYPTHSWILKMPSNKCKFLI